MQWTLIEWQLAHCWKCITCYRPQRTWGKVMFSHVSVILFTGGGGWYPSMPCRSPGPHPWEKLRGLACVCVGGGENRVSGPHPGGKLTGLAWGLQAHTRGGGGGYPSTHWGRHPPPATATGGTHPTGMHACMEIFSLYRKNEHQNSPTFPVPWHPLITR